MITTDALKSERERIRFLMMRDCRKKGLPLLNEAEIESKIDEIIKRRQETAQQRPECVSDESPGQLALFGSNDASKQTRAFAASTSRRSSDGRRDRIESWVRSLGSHGATREEISLAIELPIQTVCPLVQSLEHAGRLVPTKRTRPTLSGKPAVVLVAPVRSLQTGSVND